jgi:hypothetical protein
MPNWVMNTVNVTGDITELMKFKDYIGTEPTYATDFDKFSFHSFITLPDGTDKEIYSGPNGVIAGEEVGKEDINWYAWNNANWWTKWDACETDIQSYLDPSGNLHSYVITFNTAWTSPEPVFFKMSEMFPELKFYIHYEEEQGWGGTFTLLDRIVTAKSTWDIPASHEDYIQQDKDCVCAWDSDEDNWYEDCPKDEPTLFVFEVITSYKVKAFTEADALQAVKADENGYNVPESTEITELLYSDEYRLVDVVKEKR